jgi:hypothetical protein
MDDLRLEPVGKDVPVTDMMLATRKPPKKPNLSFRN